jgi:hypothetical protein
VIPHGYVIKVFNVGKKRHTAYFSKKLNGATLIYSTYDNVTPSNYNIMKSPNISLPMSSIG